MTERLERFILETANSLLSFFMAICLLVVGLYAGYALWDNNRIYAAAGDVRADMIRLKPVVSEETGGASFEELLAINPDVCAWVTLDNTEIDYPVLQGEDNLTYINQDVYGSFALAGSIFLDSRNDREFHDSYSLLYGHHMEKSEMFGDLDLFKEADFFEANGSGTLLLPDRTYDLKVFACVMVKAQEDAIFEPGQWEDNISGLLDFAEAEALHLKADVVSGLRQAAGPQVLALSTCSEDFTDARTIVLAEMVPRE